MSKRWYPKKGRVILHIDMNCFYASVEIAHDESLKGKPLAIAGNPEERKGIVVTSSYEARAKGVKTTMPLWEAKRLCPELLVMRPNFERYRAASRKIFKMMAEISPLIEPVSIDEGYLDITGCAHFGTPIEIAQGLQNAFMQQLSLPASIGIAPNKFLAKTASDMKKPLGITILRKRDLQTKLWPLQVGEMHGIGNKTEEKLNELKIYTIGDLANADDYTLKHRLGINGERLKNRANGIDSRAVDPDAVHDFKSIGSSRTLPHDTTDELEVFALIDQLSLQVERRLNRKEVMGSSIQLMIRYKNHETITRSRRLEQYIAAQKDIAQVAQELWSKNWNGQPVRLLGVTVQHIEDKARLGHQLDLFTFEKEANKAKLHQTIHALTDKYGEDIFKNQKSSHDIQPKTSFQKDFLDDYKER